MTYKRSITIQNADLDMSPSAAWCLEVWGVPNTSLAAAAALPESDRYQSSGLHILSFSSDQDSPAAGNSTDLSTQ